jgi:hypothetical protein
VRKDWLPGRGDAMRGMHDHLREIARGYQG